MKTFVSIIAIIVVGLAVALGIVALVGTKRPHSNLTDGAAWRMSCDAVQAALKSPATAVFPDRSTASFTPGVDLLVVASYVDSQNSFGAIVRSNWVVAVKKSGVRYTEAEILTLKER